jgi:alpha-ribazole phosphatase/probable phosphoglycerate mutase
VLTLVLTRHGHTDRSEPDQYLGQRIDIPLSTRGRADAERLRDRLAGIPFDRVISSPLHRAAETATIVIPGQPIETDARLMEADYGDWEGHTLEVLAARDPELRAAWMRDPARLGPPNGETGDAIAARAGAFLRDLAATELPLADGGTERRILAFGHSTLNRILLTVALGVPTIDYRRRFRQDWLNLTVLRLEADGRGMLVLCNDTAHLRGPGATPWP